MHKGKESKFMPILLPSHLESVKVDYNPDTRALLPDGSPVTYAIDLQFAEVKKLVREEVVALERGIDDAARHETMYQKYCYLPKLELASSNLYVFLAYSMYLNVQSPAYLNTNNTLIDDYTGLL